MIKKSLMFSTVILASIVIGQEYAANAQAWDQNKIFCVPRGFEASVEVHFYSQWEHGIKIIPYGTNYKQHTTFNNYVGRGAGPEWQHGNQRQGVAIVYNNTNASQQCYYIETKHKPSGPNGNVRWQYSNYTVNKNHPIFHMVVAARDQNNGSVTVAIKRRNRR